LISLRKLWIGILATLTLSSHAARDEWLWAIGHARAPRLRSVREWAEQEVVVPNGPYADDPYDPNLIPWTRLYLDELATGRWPRVAGTGPTQAGKTLTIWVIPILWHLMEIRETVVAGLPTALMAEDKWREDLEPTVRASPSMSALLPRRGPGSKGGSVREAVQFANGATLRFMTAGGGGAGVKGFTSRVLGVSEAVEMETAGETGIEGDKLSQLEGRLRAWTRFGTQVYLESTLSIAESRFWQEIQRGTRSRIARPCPHCGNWVTPEREHLVGWRDAADEKQAKAITAWSCPDCTQPWTEQQHRAANALSVLVHRGQTVTPSGRVEGPLPQTDTLGFRFSAVDNHFVTAGDLGRELYLAAKELDQDNAEKRICQQVFALPWIPPDVDLAPLDPEQVKRRTGTLKHGQVPTDCIALGVGIDTGKRVLHWQAIALSGSGRRHVIDYGEQPTRVKELGARASLIEALQQLANYFDHGWPTPEGDRWLPGQVWIDSGYHEHTEAVYEFCRQANGQLGLKPGQELYRPAKGYGEGPEMPGRYTAPKRLSKEVRLLGTNYHLSYLARAKQMLVHADADFWKSQLHDGLSTPDDDPKSIVLYEAPSPNHHDDYAAQIAAEEREEQFLPGRGVRRRWVRKRRKNHQLDAGYNALAAVDLIVLLAKRHEHKRRTWFADQKETTHG